MKKTIKSLVIIVSFICVLGFTNTNTSEAKTNTSLELKSAKSDLFFVVRITQNGRVYICIYLCNGILISKVEEL